MKSHLQSPRSTSCGTSTVNDWIAVVGTWFRKENPAEIHLLDRNALFLMLAISLWYFVSYLTGTDTPANNPSGAAGWWGWYDQGQYYKTTIELSQGELKPSVYWYGYPLLGAPFYCFMPRHPFFIPNLAMVLILAGSFFATCRHFMGRAEAWGLIAVFICFEPILRAKCLVIPWNTMPAYACFYLLVYLLLIAPPTRRSFAICALACGVALFSRPNEIIGLVTLYGFALVNLNGKARLHAVGFLALALLAVGLTTISLNFYFYGLPNSPYMAGESRKFSFSSFGIKIYQLFCDGAFLTGNAGIPAGSRTTQILERFPYFILLLPGACYLLRSRGPAVWGLYLAIILTVGFYLTYEPVNNPPYFWSYGSYHYFWWIIPWLGFLSYLTFRQAIFHLSRPIFAILLVLPVLLYLIIGFKAVEATATDEKNTPLVISTSYHDSTYIVELVSPSNLEKLQDIRLQFSTPPSYFGTSIDSSSKIKIEINGAQKGGDGSDFFSSQQGTTFDFSFLGKGLSLQQGDHVIISFSQTSEPQLLRASLLNIQFAPGRGVARLLTP